MKIQKRKSKRKLVLTIVLVFVIMLGVAGYFGWKEFQKINAANRVGEVVVKETSAGQFEQIDPLCAKDEDTKATVGKFCSEEMGFKFDVPKLFAGKLEKVANYPVYQSQMNPNTKTNAGTSLDVYGATTGGNGGTYTFTIAQEPMRTGYVDFHHALQNAYFDSATKELSTVQVPTTQYNYSTNSSTTTGTYAKGTAVPSFMGTSVRFYEGLNGDAGTTENMYLAVVKEKIVKISLKYAGNPASSSSAPNTKLFNELTTSLKNLRVL